uniref:Core-2/I-branching beta-1,6-N-acetylglucosaminyltransferase family protein n=1 Tax=Chenopodium quinoa TaxID=63459 RepID=A0A803M1T1_CHEQI
MAGRGGILLPTKKKMTMTSAPATMTSTKKLRFSHFRQNLKVVILISILLCIFGFWKFQSQFVSSAKTAQLSRRVGPTLFVGPRKIAFLFLTRRHLPLDFLWGSLFEEADATSYSIYIHSEPGFVFDESTTRSPMFYGRQLSNSIQVAWGESSMIEAERLLLNAALEDPANQRFVLLSDSCVPLYNFSYIYHYVMKSPKSFVDSDIVAYYTWKFQWFTLIRKHAEVVVDDELIFPVFRKYCKKLQKQHNCIPDEHYLQTLLTMMGLDKELERRTLTYTLWNEFASKMEGKGWHPVTFSHASATAQRIQEIKDINHVYYETEFRTEWCRTNSTAAPCFLFARKFSQGAAMRLLSERWLQ